MKVAVRYFFRGVRLLLTPVMLINEKLTTPRAVTRTEAEQIKINKACENLALYQFKACPFCIKVRKEMARLGLPIEIRDAQANPEHRAELLAGGGRSKVPCLRIHKPEEADQWMYESDDIDAWLRQQFEPKTQ